jgi:hypothetical protein
MPVLFRDDEPSIIFFVHCSSFDTGLVAVTLTQDHFHCSCLHTEVLCFGTQAWVTLRHDPLLVFADR